MDRTITVEGMHCSGCEQTVEDALRSVAGVTEVSADLEAGRATVEGADDVAALVKAVQAVGYPARA